MENKLLLNDSIAKLWITFRTAESTRPGKYEEQISIDGNGKRQKIKIDLQVYDTTLPSTPSLPAAFGIIEKNLIDSASKEQTLQNKLEWAELCLDYRMNPYFSTWLANSMKHEASFISVEMERQANGSFPIGQTIQSVRCPLPLSVTQRIGQLITAIKTNRFTR